MRRVYLGAIGALASLALAAPAGAQERVEPLNQYIVKGTDAELGSLAKRGFDVTEGADAPGRTGIVATPSEAEDLRDDGFDVTAVGKENRASVAAAAIPLADPTWGYDVFRPYALKPAPCQTTCSGAVDANGNPVNLMTYYDQLAAANPALVKREVYGQSLNGVDLVAYKVTRNAATTADGAKPGVLFNAAQHAREWISAEVVRRGYEYFLAHANDEASGIPAILEATEVWFVPVVNPDGYDYTFTTRAARLWRKNLRDNNNNGTIQSGDGIDTNRNFSEKWRYDNEGASDSQSSETYRGPSPESEPEVSSFHALVHRIKPEFFIDYHSYAKLVLYPVGWQVETYGADNALMVPLAGDDQHPAVQGYDPDVGGELYTTNGEITDTMYLQEGVLGYTVELDGGSGSPVGGTTTAGNSVGSNPSGFVFQDRESDVQDVFARNLPFMLDLAQSAPTPDQPTSHLGATAPDFTPSAFPIAYGSPQTVEVDVRRALGDVTVNWQIEGSSTVHQASTAEFEGGARYGGPGRYYHRVRGDVVGFAAGDKVKVWFTAGGKTSDSFTFTASPNAHNNRVLVLSAEDYTGLSPNASPFAGPQFLNTYTSALADAGIPADVYDVDANGRNHADLLGVLKHYQAVVWYTGLDDYVRDPGQTVGVSKMFDDQMNAIRDYVNEGGKVLALGQRALQSAWSEYAYNPLGRYPDKPQCRSNTSSTGPVGQLENCVNVSNDFLQYWMGAYSRANQATNEAAVSALTIAGQAPFTSSFKLTGQAYLPRFTPTSNSLPVANFPQFASRPTHVVSGSSNAVGVATADTLLWGFGLENIADAATRATVIREGLGYLGVDPYTQTTGSAAGTVPATLSLTLGAPATFGSFQPGASRTYTASTTANVISTAGDAALSITDPSTTSPGRLVNGTFALRLGVQAQATSPAGTSAGFASVSGSPRTLLTYGGPVANDSVALAFRQSIGDTDPLRTGTYGKTLTFTLSTTTP
ncbi:MAG TPA: M14 family zinc carboxypeptidase [Solirubrobacter sp.]|nr:M14 family zinc carboxypeptidase [Solirubrobacter sp.]